MKWKEKIETNKHGPSIRTSSEFRRLVFPAHFLHFYLQQYHDYPKHSSRYSNSFHKSEPIQIYMPFVSYHLETFPSCKKIRILIANFANIFFYHSNLSTVFFSRFPLIPHHSLSILSPITNDLTPNSPFKHPMCALSSQDTTSG